MPGLLDWDSKIAANREAIDAGQLRQEKLAALLGGFTGMGDRPSVMDETGETYDNAQLAGLLSDLVPGVGLLAKAAAGPAMLGGLLYMGRKGASVPSRMRQAGMMMTPVGRIAENATDSNKLAKMLIDAGNAKGYEVSASASGISPSRYITFRNPSDEAGELTRQVRISNHADKHTDLADGVRTSSDPDSGVSFEQAVNWLAREGFPTRLSTRFNNIPTWEEFYKAQAAARDLPSAKLERLQAAWLNKPKAIRGPRPTIDDVK